MPKINKDFLQKSQVGNHKDFLTRNPMLGIPKKFLTEISYQQCLKISLLNLLKEIHFTGNDLGKMVILLHVEELAAGLLRAECPSCRRTNNVIIQQIVINK